jgi:hypothetical protein
VQAALVEPPLAVAVAAAVGTVIHLGRELGEQLWLPIVAVGAPGIRAVVLAVVGVQRERMEDFSAVAAEAAAVIRTGVRQKALHQHFCLHNLEGLAQRDKVAVVVRGLSRPVPLRRREREAREAMGELESALVFLAAVGEVAPLQEGRELERAAVAVRTQPLAVRAA